MGPRLTLEQLRIFVAVAEREHVTRAAEILNLTQSTVSAAVSVLEARYGIALFHRVGRRIELTDAGRMFLEEARAVVGRAQAAELALADFGGLRRGTLHVVASQTIAGYWLPRHLATFRERYPQVELDVSIGNTEDVAGRVLDGAAELGFVEGAIDDPALAHWAVGEDKMVLVSASPADTAEDEVLRVARWVTREAGSGTRSTLEDVLRERGIDPAKLDVALVLPSNEAVRAAAEAGVGVAVLSALVVAHSIAAGTLHAWPLVLPDRPFFAIRHKERYASKGSHALLDLIKECAS